MRWSCYTSGNRFPVGSTEWYDLINHQSDLGKWSRDSTPRSCISSIFHRDKLTIPEPKICNPRDPQWPLSSLFKWTGDKGRRRKHWTTGWALGKIKCMFCIISFHFVWHICDLLSPALAWYVGDSSTKQSQTKFILNCGCIYDVILGWLAI